MNIKSTCFLKKIKDYDEIEEGMFLYCVSEEHKGTVRKICGVLHTDCAGWGMEPISEYDIDDLRIITQGEDRL